MGEKAAAPSSMNEEDWRGTFRFCHNAYNLVVRGSRTADGANLFILPRTFGREIA